MANLAKCTKKKIFEIYNQLFLKHFLQTTILAQSLH